LALFLRPILRLTRPWRSRTAWTDTGPTIDSDNKAKMAKVRASKKNIDPRFPNRRFGNQAELDRLAREMEKREAAEFKAAVAAEVEKRLTSMKSKPLRKVVDGQHGGWRPGAGRTTNPASEAQSEPWVALGLSKATYYRRKRKGGT
jgi:hypothetical protein